MLYPLWPPSVGRAEKGYTTDVNYVETNVTLRPLADWPEAISYQALAEEMQGRIEKEVPTVVVPPTQPIQSPVEELISGVRATLALKLYGPDLSTPDRLAGQIKGVLAGVPGVADLSLEANTGKPQIAIRADWATMARDGVSLAELLQVVRANQNQGPIAEAEARRKEEGARFLALQAKVIGKIDRARVAYLAAARTVATADTLLRDQARHVNKSSVAIGLAKPIGWRLCRRMSNMRPSSWLLRSAGAETRGTRFDRRRTAAFDVRCESLYIQLPG